MRITAIELNGIGVFEDVRIDFEPCPLENMAEIHIFTGTNGSGKSTILKALAAAFEIVPARAVYTSEDINKLHLLFRKNNKKASFATVSFDYSKENYTVKITPYFDALNRQYLNFYPSEINRTSLFFAYSSYRGGNTEQNIISENDSLHEDNLAFNKKINPYFDFEKWIKENLFKRAYANLKEANSKEHNYLVTIQKLEKAISEILEYDIHFELDSNSFNNVVVVYNGIEHVMNTLPDGLKSIISWLGDLCMRLEKIPWENDQAIFDRNIILFLDEIEVHLHIEWQRKILPVVQKLFPHAQIFISTHSPFVVNSVDGAWVYNLEVEKGNARVRKKELTEDGNSISLVLDSIFKVNERFGWNVETDLKRFYTYKAKVFSLENITAQEHDAMKLLAKKLASQSEELDSMMSFDLRQIEKLLQKTKKV